MQEVLLFCFAFLFWVVLSIVIWTVRNGISPMPTTGKVKDRILEELPGELEGVIYELGSGWGTLAFPLAKKYPNCRIIGYENSTFPFLFSKLRYLFSPLKNLELRREDFFKASIDDATGVICYLFPGAMKKLRPKLEHELKEGTFVVSNTFSIPGWKPEKIITMDDLYQTQIFFFVFSSTSHTLQKK